MEHVRNFASVRIDEPQIPEVQPCGIERFHRQRDGKDSGGVDVEQLTILPRGELEGGERRNGAKGNQEN